jgi:hypothetical protein
MFDRFVVSLCRFGHIDAAAPMEAPGVLAVGWLNDERRA